MITEVFPIEINGVKYRIDESMEQAGYVLHRQPLRAPVNGFIQGESGRFQLRPDILEWSLSDWSGGEGYQAFDADNPARYSLGYNLDPFHTYGTLRLSPAAVEVLPHSGDEALETGHLVVARENLYFIDNDRGSTGLRFRVYDSANVEWDIADSEVTGANDETGLWGAWGTSKWVFIGFGNGTPVKRWDGTTMVTYATPARISYVLGEVGGSLFTAAPASAGLIVEEGNMAGTPPVTVTTVATLTGITEGSFIGATPPFSGVVGTNALYVMTSPTKVDTTIWRITPTTAAGAGFGEELIKIPGFRGLTMLSILGHIYIVGMERTVFTVFVYNEADDSFGVVYKNTRRVATHTSAPARSVVEAGSTFGAEFSKGHFVAMGGPNFTSGREWSVMTLDSVSEGVAGGTVIDLGASTTMDDAVDNPDDFNSVAGGVGRHVVATFEGDLFVALNKASRFGVANGVGRTYRLAAGTYTTNTGIMESPINDFNVAEKKVLLSFHVDTEPLPADTEVVVKYQIDQSGSWVTAGTHGVDGENESLFTVSFGGSTVEFNSLQVRLELTTQNTSATPVVLRLATRAAVVKGVRVWDLLLDASDEDGQAQDRSWNGTSLMSNIATAGDSGSVVTFKDGYRDRNPNAFSTHNVVVDEYRILGDRPGEGHIMVRLRETT